MPIAVLELCVCPGCDMLGCDGGNCMSCEHDKGPELPEHHSLLPFYLQNILRRAVSDYPDHPMKRMIAIENAIKRARREYPKGFKEADR